MSTTTRNFRRHAGLLALSVALWHGPNLASAIDLADVPLFSSSQVPGNLALTLSVEWPTASTPAYPSNVSYSSAGIYYGYFDPGKCYRYVSVLSGTSDYSGSYFQPDSAASSHTCTSTASKALWSGNYLNWATTHTLDAFRWALTGGTRDVDTTTQTILVKTWHNGSGGHSSIYPDKKLDSSATDVSGATPFGWGAISTRIWGGGVRMWFTSSNTSELKKDNVPPVGAVPYTGQSSASTTSPADAAAIYEVYVRVKVCDASVGLEQNCVAYGSNAKPEGLLQQYAGKLRYSAFGYLNDSSLWRDGGVMRARMKHVGPTRPVPGSVPVSNPTTEWDASTGVMLTNPDASDATATENRALSEGGYAVTVANSGVLNYLNKFGMISKTYKSYDPVSELYYAATRYFKNLGNVAAYSTFSGATDATSLSNWIDSFPVITDWDDPVAYSCQKNFILGIGDVNSWADSNFKGSNLRANEPSTPSEVQLDTTVDVTAATEMVGQLEGINNLGGKSSGRYNSFFIAGLAYDAHTRDIRPDLTGMQTIGTYWVDVLEGQTYQSKNQFWLATKYGGFDIPTGFDPYAASNDTSTLPQSSWTTSTDTVGSDLRPDNYFTGGQADKIITGLGKAFARIAAEVAAATTTALASASPNEAASGGANYAASYDPKTWTGKVTGASISYASDGTPSLTEAWNAATLLDATAAANRRIVTCCTSSGSALPFTYSALSTATLHARTALGSFSNVTNVASGAQSVQNYIAWLRGDRSQELAQGGAYRTRSHLLGDIVNAKLTVVGAPQSSYLEEHNPGYTAFRRSYLGRRSVIYAGANDGMLHAFDGSLSGSGAGSELFAYIPSFTYGSTSSGPTSGLAALGNPSYTHHAYVDATPQVFDLDFDRAGTSSTASSGDWRSVLIGGLGKGGPGYYAMDVTDPDAWTSETAVAGKVLWEFTDSRMGYSYGDARVIKTAKYGWVAVLASGYNNSDGKGYLFFVNPKTGALLEAVATPEGSTTAPINLAHLSAFIPDLGNYTATELYGADLQGNVWRLDLTPSSGSYAAPTKIARLTAPDGTAQPVTTAPRIMIDPTTKKRYVFVGTGRLLADSDITSTQVQSLYALVDGTASAAYTSGTLPSGASYPVTRSQLAASTSTLSGVSGTTALNIGWVLDLGRRSGSLVAERITLTPAVNNGTVGVAVNLPGGDACAAAGSSYTLALDYSTGVSALTDSAGTLIARSDWNDSIIADLAFRNIGGRLRLLAGRNSGSVLNLPGSYNRGASLRRISWREIPTSN